LRLEGRLPDPNVVQGLARSDIAPEFSAEIERILGWKA
jgi:hypothetical protein